MTLVVTNLGEIGAIGGILRPLDLTLERNGATWDLTGYTSPRLAVVDPLTGTAKALTGVTSIVTPASGLVRYTPGANDTIASTSGLFEARVWAVPPDLGTEEPSALFRYTIGGACP